jgi:hypothetical protein
VVTGDAIGLCIAGSLNVAAGDQIYVLAPLAFNNADVPMHIVLSPVVAITTMFEFTVTVTVPVPVHPAVVPVTLYVVVALGNACGFPIFDWLNPVEGVHEYDPAPEAMI